jgi:hypothetical protein
MDIVKLDVPLFIRLLELAREDVKQDADLHDVAEAVIKLSQDDVATMADYNSIVSFMNKQGKEESAAEGVGDYMGRKLGVKVTQGKPNPKNAPRWATSLGQTPQGAWHWLEKKGPLETPDSDRYFPLSGKTEFTGFVSDYEEKGVEEANEPKMVKDRKTGKEYNPDAEFNKLLKDPKTVSQFKRMAQEKGKGWPAREDYSPEDPNASYAVDELDRIKQLGGIR